jgi:ATP-binding cassette, subfamily B, bacterial HlyB/CyaB
MRADNTNAQEQDAAGAAPRSATIGVRALWDFAGRFRWTFLSIAALSLFVNAIELALPLTFMMIVDSITAHHTSRRIDIVIVGFVLLVTFGGALSHLSYMLSRQIGRRIGSDLASRFTTHLLSLPVGDFKDIKGADVLSRIADLSIVHRVLLNFIAIIWVDLLFVGACISIGFYFSHLLGLIMLVRFPLYLAVARTAIAKLRSTVRHGARTRRDSSNLILDVLGGIETIKSHNAEDYAAAQINRRLGETTDTGGDYADFRGAIGRYSQVIDRLAVGAILWVGAHQVIAGVLTLGQIMAVYLMNRLMTRPINRLAGTIYDTQTAIAGLDELNELLDRDPEVNAGRRIRPARLDGGIRFADVHFCYAADGADILQGVSLQIRPGEIVGIVGPSGSGKSTIIKLIQGLYLPSAGLIEIDQTATKVLHPRWLRERIGVVPQDCWLFNRTVAENIHLGAPAVSRQDVVAAARLACAHDFIAQLPKGYDTPASGLSGGQRQRIAIARAIAHQPKILLLDESTAALDQETEAAVVKNLESLFRDSTVVIAAHRITALRHVHKIITLEQGRIAEQGSPAELLRSGGYFASMVREQIDMLNSLGDGARVRGDRLPSEAAPADMPIAT